MAAPPAAGPKPPRAEIKRSRLKSFRCDCGRRTQTVEILSWEDTRVPVRPVQLRQKPFEGVYGELEVVATNYRWSYDYIYPLSASFSCIGIFFPGLSSDATICWRGGSQLQSQTPTVGVSRSHQLPAPHPPHPNNSPASRIQTEELARAILIKPSQLIACYFLLLSNYVLHSWGDARSLVRCQIPAVIEFQ